MSQIESMQARTIVVVPAKDEAAAIGETVRDLTSRGWRVVVVDDGSSDDTAQNARAAGATVAQHAVNLGQGAAIQTGVELALARGASYIVTFDADGQHAAEDIPRLIEALEQGYDIALGSRFTGKIEGVSGGRLAFLRAAVVVSNALSGVRLSDAHCGLKAWRAEVAPQLRIQQNRMAHASEIHTNIRRHKLRYKEVPVTIRYTEYSRRKGQHPLGAIRIIFDLLFRPTS